MNHWPTESDLIKQARARDAQLRQLAQPGIVGEHAAFFEHVGERETAEAVPRRRRESSPTSANLSREPRDPHNPT